MTATVTIKGWAGASPVLTATKNGKPFARLRVGSTDRYRNDKDEWVDAETDWYTVRVWGERAENLAASVRKGDPLVVTGRLELEKWTTAEGEQRADLVLRATALGHDLSHGEAVFRRTVKGGAHVPDDPADAFRSAGRAGAEEPDPYAVDAPEDIDVVSVDEPASEEELGARVA